AALVELATGDLREDRLRAIADSQYVMREIEITVIADGAGEPVVGQGFDQLRNRVISDGDKLRRGAVVAALIQEDVAVTGLRKLVAVLVAELEDQLRDAVCHR